MESVCHSKSADRAHLHQLIHTMGDFKFGVSVGVRETVNALRMSLHTNANANTNTVQCVPEKNRTLKQRYAVTKLWGV